MLFPTSHSSQRRQSHVHRNAPKDTERADYSVERASCKRKREHKKNAQKENRARERQIEHASCKWSTRNGELYMRATNRARELQIEHAECQVEHANAVMTLMGHRTHQISYSQHCIETFLYHILRILTYCISETAKLKVFRHCKRSRYD